MKLLRNNKTFDSSFIDSNNVKMFKQYRYSPSFNTPVIQQWFLEFVYPNIGAEYYYVSTSKKLIVWNKYGILYINQSKILALVKNQNK